MLCVDGEFGAFMQVHIQNDGPITLLLESPQLPPPKQVSCVTDSSMDVML